MLNLVLRKTLGTRLQDAKVEHYSTNIFRKQEMDKYRFDERWETRRYGYADIRLVDMPTYRHEFLNQFSYYLIQKIH
jgi:hypothetical protein